MILAGSMVLAKDIKYINTYPYTPYKKEIKLERTHSTKRDFQYGTITKNVYIFDYVTKKMGKACEYIINNDTNGDVLLVGVVGGKSYANRDLNKENSARFLELLKAFYKTWYTYIPFVNVYYGLRTDIEKNKFLRDFPKNKKIKSGESLRVLCIEVEENSRLKFMFEDLEAEF